jgi:acyl-CoA synthetase (AMP-forming)/AMP-acid ligase II
VNLPGFAQVRDRLAAARVLARRGVVDLRRPDETVRAFVPSGATERSVDSLAITDGRGTISFRELDETSNALARGLAAKGIRAGAVTATLARRKVPRDVVFVAQLPRNETGKVLKSKLKDYQ